jgi:hypothetical protein
VLGEQVGVQERQLDGVGDLFDLAVESADVLVGDVGHLLQDQFLDLGSGSFSSIKPERLSIAHVVFYGHYLAGEVMATRENHAEGLVQSNLIATGERVGHVGHGCHSHLASAGEHVDGAIVVGAENGAVGRRRLGELVHLLT